MKKVILFAGTLGLLFGMGQQVFAEENSASK